MLLERSNSNRDLRILNDLPFEAMIEVNMHVLTDDIASWERHQCLFT